MTSTSELQEVFRKTETTRGNAPSGIPIRNVFAWVRSDNDGIGFYVPVNVAAWETGLTAEEA